jgi:hypothetical protein
MKINYLLLPNGEKLIPYYHYDFKAVEINDVYYFIDGFQDYTRTSHPNLVKQASVNALLPVIREEFQWTSIYNKDLTRREKPVTRILKDLEDEHLDSIITYLQKRIIDVKDEEGMNGAIQQMKFTIKVMKAEISYRKKNAKKEETREA